MCRNTYTCLHCNYYMWPFIIHINVTHKYTMVHHIHTKQHCHRRGKCVLFSIPMIRIPKQRDSKTSTHTFVLQCLPTWCQSLAIIFSNELAVIFQQRNPTPTIQDQPSHRDTKTAGDALDSVEKKMNIYRNTYEPHIHMLIQYVYLEMSN